MFSRGRSVGHDEAVLSTRDDRVLAYTRALSAVIIPFLVGAWVILYLFPNDTQRLFAWTIRPTMTPMVLASAYLGGAYFFVRVLRARHWHAVKTGFLAVTLFATLLGVATILHWDKFNHRHVTFWIWVVLYFTAPFLVFGGWLANRRHAVPARTDEPRNTAPRTRQVRSGRVWAGRLTVRALATIAKPCPDREPRTQGARCSDSVPKCGPSSPVVSSCPSPWPSPCPSPCPTPWC
jgi:hypothetical protein